MRHHRHLRRTSLALTLVLALGAVALASSASGEPGHPVGAAVPGEIIVGFNRPVSAAAQANVIAGVGGERRRRFAGIHGTLLSVAPQRTAQVIRSLERDRRVAYAEPNFV